MPPPVYVDAMYRRLRTICDCNCTKEWCPGIADIYCLPKRVLNRTLTTSGRRCLPCYRLGPPSSKILDSMLRLCRDLPQIPNRRRAKAQKMKHDMRNGPEQGPGDGARRANTSASLEGELSIREIRDSAGYGKFI
jgi:hypothetical protein